MKHNIKKLGYFLLCIFVLLILYLSYLVLQQGEELATHPQNRRMAAREAGIIRGTIFDRKGVVLAETKWLGERGKRVYLTENHVSPFAHVVGYVSEKYGSAGLEASFSKELLGLTDADALENLLDKIFNRTPRGHDLVLTLDASLQRTAWQALNGRRGAVVALDPKTGAVLAMVSSPAFDSNAIDQAGVWSRLNRDEENAPLLNRSTQGAYPPGSAFKIVTGSGILARQTARPADTIQCPGYVVVDGNRIADNRAHGKVDFIKALALSCNTYFAREGLKLGWDGLVHTFNQFGLNQSPALGIPVRPGTLAVKERRNRSQLAESSFGQGDTLISPLHMALACSAIANNGVIMKPFLVKEVCKPDGKAVRVTESSIWLTATSPEVAALVKEGMIAAVNWGTASPAAIRGVDVAGKTGTAETKTDRQPNSLPHAWFVGFAPANDPKVVVAVVVEKSGSGSRVAAPIAREVMAAALFRR
ncbi:peptidoglycan D,D-transpeptidase FtsI family protein [Desulforamulus putei]|nr:penicillin-binding transpeptidase domain-containing protein [Desulforamulus putei]